MSLEAILAKEIPEEDREVPEGGGFGNFLKHLKGDEFTLTIQVDPESSPDTTELDGVLSAIRTKSGIHGVDINARSRQVAWDAVATAMYIRGRGVRAIPHITLRESSFAGILNQVLAAVTFTGLDAVLVVTGDKPKRETYPQCGKGVFQGKIVQLIQALDQMRLGRHVPDPATGSFKIMDRTHFAIGVAFDQNAANIRLEQSRLRRKVDARANFVMTQPIFNIAQAEQLLAVMAPILDNRRIPVMCGIWPLTSREQAVLLNANLAGVVIPDDVIEQMLPESADEEARAVGRRKARELLDHIRDNKLFNGAYVVAPNHRSREALKMLNGN